VQSTQVYYLDAADTWQQQRHKELGADIMEEIKANEAREEGRSMTIHFVIKLG
jgi:hypothetical protein